MRWLRVQVSAHKDDARGNRATCEAAYVSCRFYDGPQGQSVSMTSEKCWDERCWAVYDGAARCGPSVSASIWQTRCFWLKTEMGFREWRRESENWQSLNLNQCFIYERKMFYKYSVPFWTWRLEIRFEAAWIPASIQFLSFYSTCSHVHPINCFCMESVERRIVSELLHYYIDVGPILISNIGPISAKNVYLIISEFI